MMKRVAGSFRDPAGYVCEKDGKLFRVISNSYQADFEQFVGSGLYEKLCQRRLVIPFSDSQIESEWCWKTIQPQIIPFISYPYEWSFGQLKDAALATLDIQLAALEHGMSLKDASAYNIQFFRSRPVHIDHLSFERLENGKPWGAYRQFVMHFLGPLALIAKSDYRHGMQLRNFIDGLPLDYISKNLPLSTWLNPALFIHVHLHSMLQQKYSNTQSGDTKEARTKIRTNPVSLATLRNLAYSLRTAVNGLTLPSMNTEWGNYYEDTNYTKAAFESKCETIDRLAERYKPGRAGDLGANDGVFSRILAQHAEVVISADIDPVAVNRNYERSRSEDDSVLVHVLQDLCNPSPAVGWANEERVSFVERARFDFVMGLALIHHLCIGNNLPLSYVAKYFRSLAPVVLIEFVPKEDSQVQRLLLSRKDIFDEYSLDNCIKTFRDFYTGLEVFEVEESCRTLLLFSEPKH